jgi:hypothetical protein
MTIKVPSEPEIWREALDILSTHMGPAKAMRLISAMRIGGGDYLSLRDEMFAGVSARDLIKQVRGYERETNRG